MEITAEKVKELREKTGIGMMKCKEALIACEGDFEKAIDHLRKKGLATAAKKSARTTNEGRIAGYIHNTNKVGVLVELNCETDFVAKGEEFAQLGKDICMQVAAARPIAVAREDLPQDMIDREKGIYAEQVKGKPANIIDKIIEGKLNAFFKEVCLLEQPFIKDPAISIQDIIKGKIAKFGENISVRRFVRYQLGEET
ncbi:MAG TPA: translation elongation factor Ts [Planctomycetota bacterium]|nr:translation elongation factor Ts [Planctomycetota bacterium]